MANNQQGIRGIRQSIPSGFMIGRSSPGSSKGAPGLIPLPPLNQQPVIAGAGGKATQGGGGGVGTISGSVPNTVGQVPGTTTNDNAAAGNVGEYISSVVLVGGATSLSTGVAANVTTISLTAGDWDVWGEVWLNLNASTTVAEASANVSLTNPTGPSTPTDGQARAMVAQLAAGLASSAATVISIAPCRASLASTTSYYLNVNAVFAGSTAVAFGKLCARRAR